MKKGGITFGQLKFIKMKLAKHEDADAIVLGFSEMGSTHVRDLSQAQATALIRHLKSLDPEEQAAEKMRRKIIGMAYNRAGLPANASKEQKQAVVEWLHGWMVKYSYRKRPLNMYTYGELPKLVSQFEAVLNDLLIRL